jgi:hypothetical protein
MGQAPSAQPNGGTAAPSAIVSPKAPAASAGTTAALASAPSAASLDASKLTIVSSKKVDRQQLMQVGDSETIRSRQKGSSTAAPVVVAPPKDEKCRYCCVMFGGLMSTGLSVVLCGLHVGYGLFKSPTLNVPLTLVFKQVGWLALPPAFVGTTLHYFLVDSMWSHRKSSHGSAWFKAFALNTGIWCSLIAAGTLTWRRLMRRTTWGNRWYYKYPIPSTKLETRLLEQPDAFYMGMGWTYWALGVVSGQLGFAGVTLLVASQNKVHFMMSPIGPYAKACLPRWRREAIAQAAGFELPPTQ